MFHGIPHHICAIDFHLHKMCVVISIATRQYHAQGTNKRENTPTGASTNPKNFALNKNLTMNMIWIETWNWNLRVKLENETRNWNLKLNLKTKLKIETWNWNLKFKLEIETWNWNLKLRLEIETWNWNSKLKLEIETWNWIRKLNLKSNLKIESWN